MYKDCNDLYLVELNSVFLWGVPTQMNLCGSPHGYLEIFHLVYRWT